MKKTLVICAYPASGKSYMYQNFNGNPYTMLDSDSSKFSWIYKDGVKTGQRNPNFIEDYINHIKENIGKVDIIFVSTHKLVREALRNEGIYYITVYPTLTMKDDIIERMRCRGSTPEFIKYQESHYEEHLAELEEEKAKYGEEYFSNIYLCKDYPYLDNNTIDFIIEYVV